MDSQPICPHCGHEASDFTSTCGGYAVCKGCGEIYMVEVSFEWHENERDYTVIYTTSAVDIERLE